MSQRQKADDERLRNRRCGIDNCPSKRYFTIDGRIVCENGHEQTAEDEDGPASQVMTHKINSQPGSSRKKQGPTALTSEENEMMYLECYRFVLKGQIEGLIKLGVLSELEDVVKDLWALYVSCLSVKVTEKSKVNPKRDDDNHDDDAGDYSENQNSDSERTIIIEENSSDEEEYLDVEQAERKRGHFRSDIEMLKQYPTLRISSLFTYLGIISLRLPISLNEIYRWIIEDKIPYRGADKLIPPHLFRQLHPRTQNRFQVNIKLQPSHLHYWTRALSNLYQQSYNISFPSLNHPPLLYKYTTSLSLPIEAHSLALRLIALMNATFTLSGDEKWQKAGGYVESKLLGFLIIACKLGYDLENTKEWKEWAKATGEDKEGGESGKGTWDDVTEEDILEMKDDQMDQYLDWIQRTYIEDDDRVYASKRMNAGILSMFPLPILPSNPPPTQPPQPSNTNFFAHTCPKGIGKHIQNYTIYRANAKLPPVLSRLVQRGAKVLGVTEETLRYSVRFLEFKLCNIERDRKGNGEIDMEGIDNETEIVGL